MPAPGFRVDHVGDLAGWKTLAIDHHFALDEETGCPADGATLQTVCTLAGTGARVRVGACASCGHVTYIDRPAPDWMSQFYRDRWDGADTNAAAAEVERRRRKLAEGHTGPQRNAVTLALELPLDRSRPICEIGCGYGSSLKQLQLAGFAQPIGTDTSAHRADVARRAFGFDIVTAPFESEDAQSRLQPHGPFALIVSIHALEHTSHPRDVIAAASHVQEPGDVLVISVPNVVGEPSMSVIGFLPHLHAFSQASLIALASRCGYRMIDSRFSTDRELTMAFKRTAGSTEYAGGRQGVESVVRKLTRSLALDRTRSGRRALWWLKRSDEGGQISIESGRDVDRNALDACARGDTVRHLVVSDLGSRHTSPAESPIEIQFADAVLMFWK